MTDEHTYYERYPKPFSVGSLILRDALERHVAGGKVCDLPMGGIYLIRGENLALLGELVRAYVKLQVPTTCIIRLSNRPVLLYRTP